MALLLTQRHGMPGVDVGIAERHAVNDGNLRSALIGFVRLFARPDRRRRLPGAETFLANTRHTASKLPAGC
jgi:hypothetical protein